MTEENDETYIPRHAEHQEGAETKIRRRDDGGVTVSFSDGSDDMEVSRREFMRISGVAAASATMTGASCRYPQEEIVPYVDRPDDVEVGEANYYATVCNGCSAQCGILAKTRSGRPIKLEGNEQHPVNEGNMCARGETAYRRLYDPDRAEEPLELQEDGLHATTSWETLDENIRNAIDQVAGSGGIRILTRPNPGSARDALFDEIADAIPNTKHVAWEPLATEAIGRASETCFGTRHTPNYHLEKADFLMSLGSDFLGTWMSPTEFTRKFAERRNPEGDMSRFVVFEGAMSLTGTNADERHRVPTSRLVDIALGLARLVVVDEGYGPLAGHAGLTEALEPFAPEAVAESTGVEASELRAYADELVEHAGASLVLGGQPASSSPNGVALETAINVLNTALGNDGETVERARHSHQNAGNFGEFQQLVEEMKNGDVSMLIVDGANPVYAAPPGLDFAGAMEEVKTIVSTADRVDETALHADYLAAGNHFLESWGDSNPKEGVHSIQQPTIQPLYETRSLEASLVQWFGGSGAVPSLKPFLESSGAVSGGNVGTNVPQDGGAWYRYLRHHWKTEQHQKHAGAVDFETFWEELLSSGVWEKDDAGSAEPSFRPDSAASALPDGPSEPLDYEAGDLESMELHTFASVPLYDGRTANEGHLQELPDPVTKHTWGSYAMISPETFIQADLDQGEVVEIEVEREDGSTESAEFPVVMQPGMADNVVGVPLGYGRTEAGDVGSDLGENAFALTSVQNGLHTLTGLDATVESTGDVEELAIVQGSQVLDTEERPLMGTTTLEEYEEDPHAGVVGHQPEEMLWDAHDYGASGEADPDDPSKNVGPMALKWGMSVDMSLCTGCSACVTACQEENNVPVVGRTGIMEGREMHWMRIDRYYLLPRPGENPELDELRSDIDDDPMLSEEPYVDFAYEFPDEMENPQTAHQPMLCQHCERAPCETVCPVSATTHSTDGLNQMTYNRCVGTRYCSNNCPFKVRRFNWFNYSSDRSDSIFARITPEMEEHSRLNVEEPLPMGMNPDVTVRSRGVMEKCTFCVQRIRRAKWQLKEEGRDEFDEDDVVTACEEACPADAIDFGNIHEDSDHTVRENYEDERAVLPLAHLNVESSVAYLTDVRNTDPPEIAGGHGGGHGDGGDHGGEDHGGNGGGDSHGSGNEQEHG